MKIEARGYQPDDQLSTAQLERVIPYSGQTLRIYRMTGLGPPYSKGPGKAGRVSYRWGDVLEWLESRKRRSTSEVAPAQPMAQEAA